MKKKYNSLLYGEDLYEELKERYKLLKQLVEEKNKKVEKGPEGSIRIGVCKKGALYPQYYIRSNGEEKSRYISRRANEKIINSIIQREYDEKIIKVAERELKILQRLLRLKKEKRVEKLYDNLSIARRIYIDPIITSDEDYVKEWENEKYKSMPFDENTIELYTKKGERVRSKTERMIANTLYEHNIPYKYECPLMKSGKIIACPDFTVLNVRRRKQYYWEHFGMMDDEFYANTFVKKIDLYMENGIYLGENLISSYESSSIALNEKEVVRIIKKYLT